MLTETSDQPKLLDAKLGINSGSIIEIRQYRLWMKGYIKGLSTPKFKDMKDTT
ncbi:hypothetical protein NBRC116591_30540 [Sessilibacter corallicola]|uniref:Uncharacterized protein n=1 Tax=Sessilibacter corallicola TaxID=2904075 RepID=A0ABQ0AC59_9GAMM